MGEVPRGPDTWTDFGSDDLKDLTLDELEDLQRQSNPYGVQTKRVVLVGDFTLNQLKNTKTLDLQVKGSAAKIFSCSKQDPTISAALAQMGKRGDALSEIPPKVLVLSATCTSAHGNIPFHCEASIPGLEPSFFTNRKGEGYLGAHLFIPAKCNEEYREGKPLHSAHPNLQLGAVIDVHKITEDDLKKSLVSADISTGKVLIKSGPNSPMGKIFASEEGESYLARKGAQRAQELTPGDPNTIVSLVPTEVYDKAVAACKAAHNEAGKHLAPISTDSFKLSVIPSTQNEIDFSSVEAHPYIKALSEDKKYEVLNKPRQLAIGLELKFIPVNS